MTSAAGKLCILIWVIHNQLKKSWIKRWYSVMVFITYFYSSFISSFLSFLPWSTRLPNNVIFVRVSMNLKHKYQLNSCDFKPLHTNLFLKIHRKLINHSLSTFILGNCSLKPKWYFTCAISYVVPPFYLHYKGIYSSQHCVGIATFHEMFNQSQNWII